MQDFPRVTPSVWSRQSGSILWYNYTLLLAYVENLSHVYGIAWAVMALKFSQAKHVLISWNLDKNRLFCGCWRTRDQSWDQQFQQSPSEQSAFDISGHVPFFNRPFQNNWQIVLSGFHLALDIVEKLWMVPTDTIFYKLFFFLLMC